VERLAGKAMYAFSFRPCLRPLFQEVHGRTHPHRGTREPLEPSTGALGKFLIIHRSSIGPIGAKTRGLRATLVWNAVMPPQADMAVLGLHFRQISSPSSPGGQTRKHPIPAFGDPRFELDGLGRRPAHLVKFPKAPRWHKVWRPGVFRHTALDEACARTWNAERSRRRPRR